MSGTLSIRARVVPAALFQASFVAGVAVLKAAATAMVVARLSAEAMPPVYIGAALATALLAPLQGTLVRTSMPPRQTLLLSILVTLVLGYLAFHGSNVAVVLIYLFAEVYATLTSLRFWAAVGETFDARESKRVFALIQGAGMAGCILGGLVSKLAGVMLGSMGFLLLGALSMMACRGAASRMARVGGASVRKVHTSPRGAFAQLAADRYARAVAALAIVLSALQVGADYVFRLRAGESASEAELAALFGEVSLWVGLFATAFQFLIAGRLLSRFGIFRYLLIVPTGCLVLTGVSATVPGLWPAFVLKVVETVGSLSVNPTALQLLYAPLPDATRPVARAAIDGFIKKGGLAVGGAALLLFGGLATHPAALALTGLSAALAALVVLRLKKLYVAALESRLTRARWNSEIVTDSEAKTVLLAALDAPNAHRVLVAMSLLESRSPQALRLSLAKLLAHPSPRVRERAVLIAAGSRAEETVSRLREMAVREVDQATRAEAIAAVAALDPRGHEVVRPLLDHADVALRAAAIAGMVCVELSAGRRNGEAMKALDALLRDAVHADVGTRRETARLLGRLAYTGVLRSLYAAHLETYLRDSDASVRIIAADAACGTKLLNVFPSLVAMLGSPTERRAARQAILSYGEEAVPVLASVLNDRTQTAAVRYEVPRILRYLGTARAAETLLFSNIQDDPMLRYRIVLALSRMRRQFPELPMDRERIQQAIGRRVDACAYYRAALHELAPALQADGVLMRALRDRLAQNVETVFRLLALLYPQESVMRAYEHVRGAAPHERAVALELLDNLLPEEERQRLAPVVDPPAALPPAGLEQATARLAELVASPDTFVRALAVYTAHRVMPELARNLNEEELVASSVIEKVILIEGVDIFAKSDSEDLMALAQIAQEKSFQGGETIYATGDEGDAVYIIVEGRVRIEKDGRRIIELQATESFGETSLLDGTPRPATAIASEPTRVLWIDRQDFLDLVSDRPELLKGVFAAVTRNLERVLEAVAAGKLGGAAEERTGTTTTAA